MALLRSPPDGLRLWTYETTPMEYNKHLRSVYRWGKPVFTHEIDDLSNATPIKSPKELGEQDGIHTFIVAGIPIDCLLRISYGKPLFVFLNPLINRSVDLRLPVFVGQRVCPGPDSASCLSISDPTLIFNKDLRVAWFQGYPPAVSLPSIIIRIISYYKVVLGAPVVILCGGSSAGFASMSLLSGIDRCIAITWNSQIDIGRFFPPDVLRYARLFDPSASPKNSSDVLRSYIDTDVTRSLELTKDQALFALQNASDDHHVRYHWMHFLQSFSKKNDFDYGWITSEIFALLGSWGEGHAPLPREMLREILKSVAHIVIDCGNEWDVIKLHIVQKLTSVIRLAGR